MHTSMRQAIYQPSLQVYLIRLAVYFFISICHCSYLILRFCAAKEFQSWAVSYKKVLRIGHRNLFVPNILILYYKRIPAPIHVLKRVLRAGHRYVLEAVIPLQTSSIYCGSCPVEHRFIHSEWLPLHLCFILPGFCWVRIEFVPKCAYLSNIPRHRGIPSVNNLIGFPHLFTIPLLWK